MHNKVEVFSGHILYRCLLSTFAPPLNFEVKPESLVNKAVFCIAMIAIRLKQGAVQRRNEAKEGFIGISFLIQVEPLLQIGCLK